MREKIRIFLTWIFFIPIAPTMCMVQLQLFILFIWDFVEFVEYWRWLIDWNFVILFWNFLNKNFNISEVLLLIILLQWNIFMSETGRKMYKNRYLIYKIILVIVWAPIIFYWRIAATIVYVLEITFDFILDKVVLCFKWILLKIKKRKRKIMRF